MSVASTCKTIPVWGCLIVAPLVRLLLISLTPQQLKLNNNPPLLLKLQDQYPRKLTDLILYSD